MKGQSASRKSLISGDEGAADAEALVFGKDGHWAERGAGYVADGSRAVQDVADYLTPERCN